jgi:hypothetical protein
MVGLLSGFRSAGPFSCLPMRESVITDFSTAFDILLQTVAAPCKGLVSFPLFKSVFNLNTHIYLKHF